MHAPPATVGVGKRPCEAPPPGLRSAEAAVRGRVVGSPIPFVPQRERTSTARFVMSKPSARLTSCAAGLTARREGAVGSGGLLRICSCSRPRLRVRACEASAETGGRTTGDQLTVDSPPGGTGATAVGQPGDSVSPVDRMVRWWHRLRRSVATVPIAGPSACPTGSCRTRLRCLGGLNTVGFGIWFVWLIALGLLMVGIPRRSDAT